MIREQFELKGKTALVVGGRGFLGRRFCNALVEFGAKVYAADLPQASMAAKYDTSEIQTEGIYQLDIDVRDEDSVAATVKNVFDESKRIDILVYSVTAKPKDFFQPFTECSLEGWKTVISAELDGLFLVAKQVGKIMERQNNGSMILLSSIYGVVGNDQRIYEGSNLANLYVGDSNQPKRIYAHASYPAAKGAVISLARYLAANWGEQNIRVNALSPGGLAHPGENEEFVKRYSAKVPLGRKADLDEISATVVYLASEASSYVTGQNIIVDGGWTIW
jgi:NAD(P)-dependent dehydrogenase (short-subunit alcohol dehydrogenase family)